MTAMLGVVGEMNAQRLSVQQTTSRAHVRRTYRNFFPPDARWQFSGVRLARDA